MNKQEAYDRVKNLLRKNGFSFDADDGKRVVVGSFSSRRYEGNPTRFKLVFYDNYIMNVTHWDVCAAGCIEKMACLITALNSDLLCGNFELDLTSGQVSYKNVMSLVDVEHWDYAGLYDFLLLPTEMFFAHRQKLQSVMA